VRFQSSRRLSLANSSASSRHRARTLRKKHFDMRSLFLEDYSLWPARAQSPCWADMEDADWLRAAFGRLLRELREERGLSQSQLALDSGLDQTFVSLLERGRRQPSLITMFALCDALDVAPETVVRRLSSVRPKPKGA